MIKVFSLAVWLSITIAIGSTGTWSGKVVSIVDGDVVEIMQDGIPIRVRLHGIDAPERGQPFSAQAKERLAELCFNQIVIVNVLDSDSDGRLVGIIYLGDRTSVNTKLVEEGLAWWHSKDAPNDEIFERAHLKAKAARIGLWAHLDAVAPWDWRQGVRPQTKTESVTESPPRPKYEQKDAPRSTCCKVCKKGCACGDSCISCAKTCRKGPGCACNG